MQLVWMKTTSANLMAAALPYGLIDIAGAAPAIGDYVAFGIDTAQANSGPFASLVFDIGTAISGITVDDWEYSDGAGPTWTNLAAEQDNTNADGAMTGSAFDTTGVGSVHWEQDALWTDEALNGVTAYWLRAVVTAVPGPHVAPTQQTRDVYSIVWPYVDIATAQTGGGVPMLLRLRVRSQSDKDGDINDPRLFAERILVATRSLSRGSNFTPYLNASDEQNPAGVTVSLFGAASFQTSTTSPTGRVVQYLNVPAAQSICRWTIANTLSQEYLGKYHVFLRARQTGGAPGDLDLQVSYILGSGPVHSFDRVTFVAATIPVLIDIGSVDLISGLSGDIYDNMSFSIDGLGDGAADVEILELILFPIDEWAGDFNGDLDVGGRGNVGTGTYLRVDSLQGKRSILSTVRRQATDYVADFYLSITPSPAALQANANQRIWFLQSWNALDRSKFEIADSIQLTATKRYFSMRGSR
jgi:hypothetical protein